MKKFMLKSAALSLLLTLCYGASNAQYNTKENNIWTFGYRTGLNFNSGSPVTLPPLSLPANGTGSASVCDTSGNLLFYTNGHKIWDKNNQLLPNGDTIFPVVGRLSPYSGTQGALIVPVLTNPNQYYVFSQEAYSNSANDPAVCRLWYSVVDMTLNNGLGDVVPGKRSIIMDSALNGTMIAVKGEECNIWVLTHEINSNIFKAYNVTATGIASEPVISTVGTLVGTAYKWARMRISPNGKKLGLISSGNGGGITGAGVELYDFNPATGTLSNVMYIDQIGGSGIEFSPDNSKLYITGVVPVTYTYSLFQFDVTQTTAAAIKNSRQVILNTQWLDLRLAPDGKIYHIINGTNMGVINSPNLAGTACNYVPNVITSTASVNSFGSYFPSEYIKGTPADTLLATTLDTFVCPDFGTLTLSAAAGSSANLWDDGSRESTRIITEPGTYYVYSAVDFCTNRIDTFTVSTFEEADPVITVNGFVLGTTASYSAYQWFLNNVEIPGATNSTLTVTENGDYTVAVTTENGCKDTSDIYKVTNIDGNTIGDAPALAAQISIYPNPATDQLFISAPVPVTVILTSIEGKVLKQLNQVHSFSTRDLPASLYLLRIEDQQGNLIKVTKFIKIDG